MIKNNKRKYRIIRGWFTNTFHYVEDPVFFNTIKDVKSYCLRYPDVHTWKVEKHNKLTGFYDTYKTLNKTLLSRE